MIFGYVPHTEPLKWLIAINGSKEFAATVVETAWISGKYTVGEIQAIAEEFRIDGWTRETWCKGTTA